MDQPRMHSVLELLSQVDFPKEVDADLSAGLEKLLPSFTAKDLKEVGFTAQQLHTAGFVTWELKDSGYGARELQEPVACLLQSPYPHLKL